MSVFAAQNVRVWSNPSLLIRYAQIGSSVHELLKVQSDGGFLGKVRWTMLLLEIWNGILKSALLILPLQEPNIK